MLERGGGRRTVAGRIFKQVELDIDSGRRWTGMGGTGGGGYLGRILLLLRFEGEAGPVNDSRESR